MSVAKIVLTGGPCAGKTTAKAFITEEMTQMGYKVLFIPETATMLIEGGADPAGFASMKEFEKIVIMSQLNMEKSFMKMAEMMPDEKILVVCDRGVMDIRTYIGAEDFTELLRECGLNEVEIRDGYDAVFHLVTAAKGAAESYTTANNSARKETPEEAAAIDDSFIEAWTGHPHFRVVDNSTDFENKMLRLVEEIAAFLGEPEPFEIERKYLIEYPDLAWLEAQPNCRKVEIIQTYLLNDNGDEVRVRQRGYNGNYVYFHTTKRKVSSAKRIEIENRISEKEYLRHLMNADPNRHPIRKNRYCLTYDGQYFEIDIYPFWNDKAVCEIELRDEKQQVNFPAEIRVIEEVTDNPEYSNAKLAMK